MSKNRPPFLVEGVPDFGLSEDGLIAVPTTATSSIDNYLSLESPSGIRRMSVVASKWLGIVNRTISTIFRNASGLEHSCTLQ
jgi:hypothetical protein